MKNQSTLMTVPTWYWIVAALGLFWNTFGAYQFLHSFMATKDSLVAMGMTEHQAQTMAGYPVWMSVAFAVGTFGGLAGCLFLLLRKKLATTSFIASLVGYIILYIGDITEGVFAALGMPQVIVLTVVVAIAIGLLVFARVFQRRGALG